MSIVAKWSPISATAELLLNSTCRYCSSVEALLLIHAYHAHTRREKQNPDSDGSYSNNEVSLITQ